MPQPTEAIPPLPCTPNLITTLPALRRIADRLLASPAVAVDTESDSLYSYHEKICLVQFSLPDTDYLVDPLAIGTLEPLADLFASPAVEKVFHGADYDITSLKRGYGFRFASIFDTMLASRILGRQSYGLASLLSEHLGIALDKRMQRSDWGHRPLTPAQLVYACHDTRHLLKLHGLLLEELRRTGREEEAREIFAELTSLEPRPKSFDPDAFWHIHGVRDLDTPGQRVVRALYLWRDEQAQAEDKPVFKLMGERTLVALGQTRPTSLDALRQSHVLSHFQLERYGQQVVSVVAQALTSKEQLPRRQRRRDGRPPDEQTVSVYEALRTWRKERAAQRGTEPDIVASNDLLMTLASRRPRSLADLESVPGLGPWRRRSFGAEMLATIARAVGR